MGLNRLKIRRGGESDREALREMGCESYRQHFSQLWSPVGIREFLDADFSDNALRLTLGAPSRHLWLLASDPSDEMVGYAKLNWSVADPVFGLEGTELQKIYFVKSAAGKGYGSALIERIFDCVRKRSGKRIWLDVLKNNTSAQDFYKKKGFKVAGEMPFKTDLTEIGMVVMTCDLS